MIPTYLNHDDLNQTPGFRGVGEVDTGVDIGGRKMKKMDKIN